MEKYNFIDGVIVDGELIAYGSFARTFESWVKRMWNSVSITQAEKDSFSTTTGEIVAQTPQVINAALPVMNYETSFNGIITLTEDIANIMLENVPDGGGGNIVIIEDEIGGWGIDEIRHSGLTVMYLGAGLPTADNINSVAEGHTILRYDRLGNFLYVSFAPFETALPA